MRDPPTLSVRVTFDFRINLTPTANARLPVQNNPHSASPRPSDPPDTLQLAQGDASVHLGPHTAGQARVQQAEALGTGACSRRARAHSPIPHPVSKGTEKDRDQLAAGG